MLNRRRAFLFVGQSLYLSGAAIILLSCLQFLRDKLQQHDLLLSVSSKALNWTDFLHFYMAGQLALHSTTRAQVYDVTTQLNWQRVFANAPGLQSVFYFQLPPPTLLLLAPLANFSPQTAYILLMCVSTAALIAVLWASRSSAHKNIWQTLVFVIATFATLPACLNMFHGQFEFLLLAQLVLFYYGLQRQRNWLAGVALGSMVVRPQYQLFLGFILIMRKQWRMLAIAVATSILAYIAAGIFLGFDTIVRYPAALWFAETDTRIVSGENAPSEESIRGLLSSILPRKSALIGAASSTLLAMMGCGWLFKNATTEPQQNLSFAISIICCVFFSAHTHLYDWLLPAIGAWYTVDQAEDAAGVSTNRMAPVRAWQWLCVAYPFASWLIFMVSVNRSVWYDALHLTYLVVACFALATIKARESHIAT